ncbi:outer membrane beta-barrel protein [Halioxenophilus sp. WMMB6]|uniref:outer membrane beta-barrel protein n=1 Tax=Halioxenophilus sp. WMMB6 TaxID=3073815 RepID=UPI00295E7E8D|nr:outer membrane beta-barrel protein [Halioxenophilus sp. WMMB6]
MNTNKHLLTSLIAAAVLGSAGNAMAETTMGDVVISGYLDMSASYTEFDDASDSSTGLDRAEVRFNSQLDDKVSIEAHVAGGADEDYTLEHAMMVYQATDKLSFKAGKYLSALGWEAFHAPDLFQYSTSVALVYPAFFNGAAVTYTTDDFMIYGSLASDIWNGTDTDSSNVGAEGAFKFTGVEDLTVFLGFATSKVEPVVGDAFDQTLVNFWTSYSINSLLLAFEYNDVSDWGVEGNDGDSWLVMANYGFTDKIGLTLRTSAIELDDGTDLEKYTAAGSYVLTDNVSFVLEYNNVSDNATDTDADTVALEMIVVF